MIEIKRIEEVADRVAQLLPAGADRLHADVKRNVRGFLDGALARMELVTREEFDVQQAVLARTRAKLTELERRVAELEALCERQAAARIGGLTGGQASSQAGGQAGEAGRGD
jgi:hypothetical protein